MKSNRSKLIYFIVLACTFSFFGWNNTNNQNITDFYYYKDAPFRLTKKTDRLYIRFKEPIPESRFRAIIGSYEQINSPVSYDSKETKFFVSLNSTLSDAGIISLAANISSANDVEYCSPVFSPDNGKTLIGVEDEIIVQFKPTTSSVQMADVIRNNNLHLLQKLSLTGGNTFIFRVEKNQDAVETANRIYLSGLTVWSEPNLYFTNLLCYTPNDTYYPQQWAIKNTGNNIPDGIIGTVDCDMDVDSAWDINLSSDKVKVAVIDTGVDTLHEDLAANMVPGSGYNFYNNTPGAYDDGNHGTCCAGIIAAVGNNNMGVSGIAPNAKIIPVKWLSSSGNGNYTGATNATIYAYQQGAWVLSNSWGFVGGASSALDQAITDAATLGRNGKGSLFVVASGNENGAMRYPASTHPRVLVVGGISPCNQRKSPTSCDNESWWGASYGSNLDIVSPCVKIYTTDRMGSVGYTTGNYEPTFNGTSSATPNTAGVCALVFSVDSSLTWDTVRARIDYTAEKVGAYTYDQPGPRTLGLWNGEMGYGKVNAYNVVKYTQEHTGQTLANDIAVGPFLNLPPLYLINNTYAIKTRIMNVGSLNQTNVPFRFFINGILTDTTNKNLTSGQIDSVSYNWTPVTAGSFTLMYVSALAADSNRINDTVRVTVNVTAGIAPVCEGFTSTTYPPAGWNIVYTGTLYWTRETVSGYGTGTGSSKFNFYNAGPGITQGLITAQFPATTGNTDSLKFQHAYCTYQTENDQLELQTSTDSGASWITLVTLNGGVAGALVTAPPQTGVFTPSASQWGSKVFALPIGTNRIRFNAISAYGNNLFLDSICVVTPVGTINPAGLVPGQFSLSQNYPNPFNPVTSISYSIQKSGHVELKIYNVLGEETAALVNEMKQPGIYKVNFDASNFASGVYFYRIISGDFTDVKKMVLIK